MKFYVLKIEQIISEGTLTEYANVTKFNDKQSAEVNYFQALSNVANDIGPNKNHTFMKIQILDSFANILRQESIGEYQQILS